MVCSSRSWRSAVELTLAALLLFVTPSAFAQVTGPDVVSGDTYTVTYTRQGTTTYLQEKIGSGGTWVNITSVNGGSGGVPYTFYGKPAGEYFYRTNVRTVGYRGIVTWWTSAEKRIVVTGALPSNRDTIANQMRYIYQARIGDINYDGLLDLFISRVSGGSAGNGSLQDVILRNVGGGAFVPDVPTAPQAAAASSWSVSAVRLQKTDMNLDGFLDLSIPELGQYISGAMGQIAVAPGGTGPAVQRLIPMDAKFRKFMTQTQGWLRNPNYFVDNSQLIAIPVWGYIYTCDYVWRDNYYEWVCGYIWTVVGYTLQYDLSWVDLESNYLRYSFAVDSNGALQLVAEPGSPQGQNIDAIFSAVFGVQALRGGFRSYCTNWDYDTEYHPPCVDWAAALMAAIYDLFHEDGLPYRYLTPGEKLEAYKNGLDIIGVEEVRVYNAAQENIPPTILASVRRDGHIYIRGTNPAWNTTGMPYLADYSINWGPGYDWMTVFVHELTHVHQIRTRGCGYFCILKWGTQGRPVDYIYYPQIYEARPYYEYNLEQQAEMVSDRFRFLNGLVTTYRAENGGLTPWRLTLNDLNSKIPFAPRYP